MEMFLNAQLQQQQQSPHQQQSQIQYSRSPFEFPSKHYESYQENGTKYLKSTKTVPDGLKQQLNACAGEIFLSGIPPEVRAEQIAEIAALLGELYILRYKVNFSGDSRGFAYLQYLNPTLMQFAITRLPSLFRQHALPMIRVRESRNSSKLLLKKTYRMSPQCVYATLRKLISFDKLVGREIFPGYFEYQIIFKCNEEAVHARRELLRTISKFGRNAIVVWDTSTEGGDAAEYADVVAAHARVVGGGSGVSGGHVGKTADLELPSTQATQLTAFNDGCIGFSGAGVDIGREAAADLNSSYRWSNISENLRAALHQ